MNEGVGVRGARLGVRRRSWKHVRGSGGCARLQPAAWYLCESVAQSLTTGRLESAQAAAAAPCAGGVGVRVGERARRADLIG